MCGWDWGACLPDGGIFRPVTLLGIETARLDSVYIRQVHKDGKVLLVPEVDVETVDEEESEADGYEGAQALEYQVTVTAPNGTKPYGMTVRMKWRLKIRSSGGQMDWENSRYIRCR